jgi:hypothetical protein
VFASYRPLQRFCVRKDRCFGVIAVSFFEDEVACLYIDIGRNGHLAVWSTPRPCPPFAPFPACVPCFIDLCIPCFRSKKNKTVFETNHYYVPLESNHSRKLVYGAVTYVPLSNYAHTRRVSTHAGRKITIYNYIIWQTTFLHRIGDNGGSGSPVSSRTSRRLFRRAERSSK